MADAGLSGWHPIVEPGRAPGLGSVEIARARDEERKTAGEREGGRERGRERGREGGRREQ